ncbi:MAG: hypothetical protein KGI78_04605 [Patescibacteria group bacterium]|nr:hypothetical protein [Patescibacteria group bacterium]MDE1945544.1 hypothetical protein [Patescibacteria group bacterium]MDE2058090.1 hypothetical protein [Patescibacteria group bacterium]
MNARRKEQARGGLVGLFGVVLTMYFWATLGAAAEFPIVEATGPVWAILGFAVVLFPSSNKKSLGETGPFHLSRVWWMAIVAAVVESLYLRALGIF